MAGSSIKQRVISGAIWTVGGTAIWRGLSSIATIVVGRILGPEGFGEFAIVRSTAQMFGVYASLRLGGTAAKYVAEHRDREPDKAASILKIGLSFSLVSCFVVSAILWFSAPYLANHTLGRAELEGALAISAFFVFFHIFSQVQESALTGFENFRAVARVAIARGALTPILCIPAALIWGVEGAVLGLTMVAVCSFFQLVYALGKERKRYNFKARVPFRSLRPELYVLWRFALPGLLVGVMLTASAWLGRAILSQSDHGFAELGLFEAANQWRTLILFIPAALSRVMLPIISSAYAEKGDKNFHASVSINLTSMLIIAGPLVVIVIGFSDVLAAVFGKSFAGTESVIPMLMASVYFFALNQSVRQIYDATENRWLNLYMYLVWAIVFLTVSVSLIPGMGAVGFAVSHFVAELVLFLIQAVYADVHLAAGFLRRNIGKLLGGAGVVLVSVAAGYLDVSRFGKLTIFTTLLILSSLPLIREFAKSTNR